MSKNRVRLTICGTECVVSSDDTESYIRSVGDEVEKAIQGITDKNERVSLTMAAIITALSFCDDAHRASAAADNLRSQIKDYLEDSSRARLEAEEARREMERMKKEIQTLRARLNAEGEAAEPAPAPKPAQQPLHQPVQAPAAKRQEPSAKPAAPVQRPNGQAIQAGGFARPQQASSQAPVETDLDGFMSFFEKKETD